MFIIVVVSELNILMLIGVIFLGCFRDVLNKQQW